MCTCSYFCLKVWLSFGPTHHVFLGFVVWLLFGKGCRTMGRGNKTVTFAATPTEKACYYGPLVASIGKSKFRENQTIENRKSEKPEGGPKPSWLKTMPARLRATSSPPRLCAASRRASSAPPRLSLEVPLPPPRPPAEAMASHASQHGLVRTVATGPPGPRIPGPGAVNHVHL